MRLINFKFVKRLDLSALDFGSYMNLLAQVSFFIFSKTHPHLTPAEMMMRMIE